jgi:hypothetical protein
MRFIIFPNSAKGTYDKAVLAGRTACSVKVVAGARNHRELTAAV